MSNLSARRSARSANRAAKTRIAVPQAPAYIHIPAAAVTGINGTYLAGGRSEQQTIFLVYLLFMTLSVARLSYIRSFAVVGVRILVGWVHHICI